MNRTTLLLSSAAVLALLAAVLGLPHLRSGTRPPPDPVRPPPAAGQGSLSVTGALSNPWLAPGQTDVYATLEVAAVDVPGARRAPVNLAVVLDRSGSMAGAKVEAARQAALRLVDLLDEHDRLSVTHYGNEAVTLPGTFATAEGKAALRRFILGIEAQGGTNIAEGLEAGKRALEVARSDFRVNRLLLLSDGQPTVGLTSPTALSGLAASFRQAGVSVTSLGVGADFNEDLMQRLADVGGGTYAFISEQDPQAMSRLFEGDLQQAGTLVARQAALTFTLPEGLSFVEVYGRSAQVEGSQVRIGLPDFSARQREKLVVHLTARTAASQGAVPVADVALDYHDVLAEKDARAGLALAASATADRTLAAKPAAPQVVVQVARARAAVNYQAAAAALDQGDAEGARRALRLNELLVKDAEGAAGIGAMADEQQAGAVMFGLTTGSSGVTRQEAVKQLKVQSLESAGRGASVKK